MLVMVSSSSRVIGRQLSGSLCMCRFVVPLKPSVSICEVQVRLFQIGCVGKCILYFAITRARSSTSVASSLACPITAATTW